MIECDQVVKVLCARYLPGYGKGRDYYMTHLAARTNVAIERARKLAKAAQRDGLDLPDCVCADGVADLVQALLSL